MRCSISSIVAELAVLLACGTLYAQPVSQPVSQPAGQAGPHVREPEPSSLDQLLARLHAIAGLTAQYDEEKHISLLKRPLASHGSIYFAAPNWLLRRVERPEPSAVLLQGDTLQISDATGTRRVDLQQSAALRQFVSTFVHVLAGERAALDALYDVHFSARKSGGWNLVLVPRQADLKRFIARAEFEGHGGVVERMSVHESNGDATVMRFSQVDLDVRFDDAARARVFRLTQP
jgi:outer membrane lipoprotein-sorting protein